MEKGARNVAGSWWCKQGGGNTLCYSVCYGVRGKLGHSARTWEGLYCYRVVESAQLIYNSLITYSN